MWLCLPSAFLSIVDKDCEPDELLVRARRKGDIQRIFPGAKVQRTPGNDYLYRAVIKREVIGETLARLVDTIGYPNFKSTVRNTALHDAYSRVWGIMSKLQEIAPYSRGRARRQERLL